jgi:hypothetical protein
VGHDAAGLTVVPFLPRRRIDRARDGSIALRLPSAERELLASLPDELRTLLDDAPDDPSLRRLFPPAYEDDGSEREYRDLTRDALLSGRLRALETIKRTAAADRLDEAESKAWLTGLNDLRLVLGSRLDVTESFSLSALSPRHPQAREYAVYVYLSYLQEQLVEALSAGLPDATSAA